MILWQTNGYLCCLSPFKLCQTFSLTPCKRNQRLICCNLSSVTTSKCLWESVHFSKTKTFLKKGLLWHSGRQNHSNLGYQMPYGGTNHLWVLTRNISPAPTQQAMFVFLWELCAIFFYFVKGLCVICDIYSWYFSI